jgi:hypothetical protein
MIIQGVPVAAMRMFAAIVVFPVGWGRGPGAAYFFPNGFDFCRSWSWTPGEEPQ